MVFPFATGGTLVPKDTLLETLCVSPILLRRTCWETNRQDLRLFTEGAEESWRCVRDQVIRGEMHFIRWFRKLLTEVHESKIWIPPIFLKRLGELHRRELIFIASRKRHVPVPFDGMPAAYVEFSKLWGWTRCYIVPSIHKGSYEDVHDFSEDGRKRVTSYVQTVLEVWKRRPIDISDADLQQWIQAELAKKGFRRR